VDEIKQKDKIIGFDGNQRLLFQQMCPFMIVLQNVELPNAELQNAENTKH
jgi:hypothetical protein